MLSHWLLIIAIGVVTSGASPLTPDAERVLKPKDVFKECDKCPEMVVVPAGSFMMGDAPQHPVTIARPFAVGRFAVTIDEWDACVADRGCGLLVNYSDQGRQPAHYMTWYDAKDYVKWLSRKTGKTYRLLSEAEREYVTRAGTTTRFWWGNSISTSQANYDDDYSDYGGRKGVNRDRILPVDSFKPNPWGLYQVHGNIDEWVEDCWHENYQGAPSDGSAWTSGDCEARVARGGYYSSRDDDLRSAARGHEPADDSSITIGLGVRVARALDGRTAPRTANGLLAQQAYLCVDESNSFSPALRIDACSDVILSGRWLGKDLAWALNDRCVAYLDNGNIDLAVTDCGVAIRRDPKNPFAFNNLGNAYKAKSDYDRAIASYAEAVRLDPTFAQAFNNRGLAYGDKKDFERAISDYTDAIRLDPGYSRALDNRGDTYLIKGDLARAIADFDEAIKVDPRFAQAFTDRCDAYRAKQDYDRVIADCTQAIRLDPMSGRAFNNRGLAYSAKKDYDRAISDYNDAMRVVPEYLQNDEMDRNPELFRVFNNRGDAYLRKGDLVRAIADFSDATRSVDPVIKQEAYLKRCKALYANKNYERAIVGCTDAIRLSPGNAGAYAARAAVYQALNRNADAAADLDKARAIDPSLGIPGPLAQPTMACVGGGPTLASISSRTAQALAAAEECALKPKDVFKECDKCPEMVVVPAGSFVMGSPPGEAGSEDTEHSQRRVTIAKPFAAGRFAVTFDEWDACVAEGGCNRYRPSDQGWGRGRLPVINVSWDDAKAFTAWLSHKTGKTYRLLSEAEREYVTRAGTATPFWWGSSISTSQANYEGRGSQEFDNRKYAYSNPGGAHRDQTAPVDSYQPNPWGLFQVHGNVDEWVEDCWLDDLGHGAPTDGRAWTLDTCRIRVVRGGAWSDVSSNLRSANRGKIAGSLRSWTIGFRVGRALGQAPSPTSSAGVKANGDSR